MKSEVLKIRSTVYEAVDMFFRSNGFYEVSPPILTSFSCEAACVGGSDLVSVNYYNKKAFLSQSGQLYLEALAMQLERVYCMGPAFRAESTLLATHLSEFWMCEAEMINISFDDLSHNISSLLTTIIGVVLEKNSSDLEKLGVNVTEFDKITKKQIPQITYSDAINILRKESIPIEWGDDIQSSHELLLSKYFDNLPLMITLYPRALSSFYKQVCPDDSKLTLSLDVVAPSGFHEIVGGSMRENDVECLRKTLQMSQSDISPYEWYLETISSNPKKHGGFGLGIERLVTWLCNLNTIQDAIPFPRTKEILWP
ncbi:MAG: asparagine--tRNA ligase [Lachnospiraceae bacterium]|nr:asparagine--tRNA ligase [Lachnospiraceae bacterium]